MEIPSRLSDFPAAVRNQILFHANEIAGNVYEDVDQVTIPDLQAILGEQERIAVFHCMPHVGDGEEIIGALRSFNTARAEAIGQKVTDKKAKIPMFAVLFEHPKKPHEDEFPFF